MDESVFKWVSEHPHCAVACAKLAERRSSGADARTIGAWAKSIIDEGPENPSDGVDMPQPLAEYLLSVRCVYWACEFAWQRNHSKRSIVHTRTPVDDLPALLRVWERVCSRMSMALPELPSLPEQVIRQALACGIADFQRLAFHLGPHVVRMGLDPRPLHLAAECMSEESLLNADLLVRHLKCKHDLGEPSGAGWRPAQQSSIQAVHSMVNPRMWSCVVALVEGGGRYSIERIPIPKRAGPREAFPARKVRGLCVQRLIDLGLAERENKSSGVAATPFGRMYVAWRSEAESK